MKETKSESWEKEFDEKFVQNGGVLPHHRDNGRNLKEELKSFISLQRQKDRDSLVEMVRKAEFKIKPQSEHYFLCGPFKTASETVMAEQEYRREIYPKVKFNQFLADLEQAIINQFNYR